MKASRSYYQRIAIPEDKEAIALLWQEFAVARSQADPSVRLKAEFDYGRYVEYQLKRPLSFAFLLIYEQEIVGFLFTYVYDEAPPPQVSALEMLENPFVPRRVGAVLGLYVQESHRQPATIGLLIEAAIAKAQELQVSDIDLLIGIDQERIQALLERKGFVKVAIQYTRHFELSGADLPSLHPPHQVEQKSAPLGTIPLRDAKTNALVKNHQGQQIFLYPVTNKTGKILESSTGLPTYPIPLRDPITENWVLDERGELVLCPVLLDESGELVEKEGIPQFYPPVYELVDGKLCLKRDANGNYIFAEVERDEEGRIRRSPDGKPMFK